MSRYRYRQPHRTKDGSRQDTRDDGDATGPLGKTGPETYPDHRGRTDSERQHQREDQQFDPRGEAVSRKRPDAKTGDEGGDRNRGNTGDDELRRGERCHLEDAPAEMPLRPEAGQCEPDGALLGLQM